VSDQTVDHATEAAYWLDSLNGLLPMISDPGQSATLTAQRALVHAVLALGQQGARASIPGPVAGPHGNRHAVTADQVRVGDEIEIFISGRVTGWDHGAKYFSFDGYGLQPFHYEGHTIRRRGRAPMPEPAAPAIVRHAGVHLVRPLGLRADDEWQWLLVDQPRRDGETGCQWLSWATVLELDPLVEPEIILFGGGE